MQQRRGGGKERLLALIRPCLPVAGPPSLSGRCWGRPMTQPARASTQPRPGLPLPPAAAQGPAPRMPTSPEQAAAEAAAEAASQQQQQQASVAGLHAEDQPEAAFEQEAEDEEEEPTPAGLGAGLPHVPSSASGGGLKKGPRAGAQLPRRPSSAPPLEPAPRLSARQAAKRQRLAAVGADSLPTPFTRPPPASVRWLPAAGPWCTTKRTLIRPGNL